jgi:RNA polymerase sigma-70 factor (ECF subfamily)
LDSDPDEELVRRFVAGDRDALADLVRRHEGRVYNIAFRMLGGREDAFDAVQDVFITCLRKLASFRGHSAFTTWLHRVTVNVCLDALRRRRPEVPSGDELPEVPVPDPADSAVEAVAVQRALLRVPDEFRVVLVLHDVQGQTYETIAEILGAPIGTVKSRLHRGRVVLGRALRGEHLEGSQPSNLEESRE